jgi:hypothetical protein
MRKTRPYDLKTSNSASAIEVGERERQDKPSAWRPGGPSGHDMTSGSSACINYASPPAVGHVRFCRGECFKLDGASHLW